MILKNIRTFFRRIAKSFFLGLYLFSPTVINWLAKRGFVSTYQPIWNATKTTSNRVCADRWQVMEKFLPTESYSFLDIGAQIGYFTLQAANKGALAIGIERDPYFLALAQAQTVANKINSASFISLNITPTSISALPQVNVTCCLSVFHHWVREYGYAGADKIFSKICANTQELFFETGQGNEPVIEWQHHLSFMGENPIEWIGHYLKEKGFSFVEHLGNYPTHLSNVERALYFARR